MKVLSYVQYVKMGDFMKVCYIYQRKNAKGKGNQLYHHRMPVNYNSMNIYQ